MDNTDCPLVIEMKTSPQSEVQMPIDEDDELDFFQPEYDELDIFQPEYDDSYDEMTNSNTQKLISPYQEYAFTDEVLHEVANQSLGYPLPDEMWSYIERAFAHYWDEEVGLNGETCEDYMFLSIQEQLIDNMVFFPDELLAKVVSGIYDFMLEIPGAILDY